MNDPIKLELAARLRRETTLTIKAIAERVHLGTSKGANANLHRQNKGVGSPQRHIPCAPFLTGYSAGYGQSVTYSVSRSDIPRDESR